MSSKQVSWSKTEDEAEIEALLSKHGHVKLPEPNETGRKELQKSVALRKKGNQEFKVGHLDKALRFYTESIAYAPLAQREYLASLRQLNLTQEEEYALTLAIADRSAVLFELKKYEPCLRDVYYALEMDCTSETRYTLYERQAKCLQALAENKKNVRVEIEECLENLSLEDGLQADKKESLKKNFENAIEIQSYHAAETDDVSIKIEGQPLHISYGENENMPGFSTCVEIKNTRDMGRGIFAAREICTGDVIGMEKPFSACLGTEYYYTHCFHCMRKCYTLRPCRQCSLAMFCSAECDGTSWETYHQIDCSVISFYKDLAMADVLLMVLRTVIVAAGKHTDLQEFYETVKSYEKDGEGFKIDPEDYHTVYSLETNRSNRSTAQLRRLGVQAIELLNTLDTKTNFFSQNNRQSSGTKRVENLSLKSLKVFIGGLILRHLQVVPHQVNLYKYKPSKILEEASLGSATYPIMSLINHSCDANSHYQTLNGNECTLRATRPISKGEQIFNFYGVTYIEDPEPTLRELCLDRYFFKCHCIACTKPLQYRKVIIAFHNKADTGGMMKCQGCNQSLGHKFSLSGNMPKSEVNCSNCHQVNDLKTAAKEVKAALKHARKEANNDLVFDVCEMDPYQLFDIATKVNHYLVRPSVYHAKCDVALWNYFYKEAHDLSLQDTI